MGGGGGAGVVSQHTWQVVSQHALLQISGGGGGIPACLAAGLRGDFQAHTQGGLKAHTQGGLQAHTHGGVSKHALRQTSPPRGRLLSWAVRILLECILVLPVSGQISMDMRHQTDTLNCSILQRVNN